MCRIVGIIPARGGSKGIPRKNIKLMLGKPLIQHTIEAALASKRIDEVYVSTEDYEIASISESLGTQIIDRPEELAGDKVSTFDVMKHAEEILTKPELIRDAHIYLKCKDKSKFKYSHFVESIYKSDIYTPQAHPPRYRPWISIWGLFDVRLRSF